MLVRLLSREIHEVLSRERRRIRERCSINQYHQYLVDLSPYLPRVYHQRTQRLAIETMLESEDQGSMGLWSSSKSTKAQREREGDISIKHTNLRIGDHLHRQDIRRADGSLTSDLNCIVDWTTYAAANQ